MIYDFTTLPKRKGTNSYKWDTLSDIPAGTIPVWVADMDFVCAPQIQKALLERVRHPVYGYTFMADEDYNAILNWINSRHGYIADRNWLVPIPGVVCAMNATVDELTNPGDKIVIMPPVYPPFFKAADNREILYCPLTTEDGVYAIDYNKIEQCFRQGARLLILCNPHNPVGRAWSFGELSKLGELCERYDINVISDDIHCDIILPGNSYTSVMRIDSLKNRSVALISGTKTFNIAGLQAATAIIPDMKWRTGISERLGRYGHEEPNLFAITAQTAAYKYCSGWVDELTAVIESNIKILLDALQSTPIKSHMPGSTYLVWLDCRNMGMDDKELMAFFINTCGIYPNSGKPFGAEGFARINAAAPETIIKNVALNIKRALNH